MAGPHLDVVLLGSGSHGERAFTGRELGGKGASLAHLATAGVPIPPTAIITTDVYRRFIETTGLTSLVTSIRRADQPPDGDRVDDAFCRAPLPASANRSILEAARRIGPRIAVRSSATAEDLGERSFAGQYRSILDVDTADEASVLDAVRSVWASLWHPAPWAYRRAWAVDEEGLAMAVVLMAMVPARTAGVAFGRDPVGGSDLMRIESVDGLGERLVSGDTTPDVWLLDPDPNGQLPPDAPSHLSDIRRHVHALERLGEQHLDVEWAWDGSLVWIVQSRPITTDDMQADGFDTPLDDHECTTAGIEEMVPGVLPPLRWEVNSFLVEEALRRTLDVLGALGADEVDDHRFLRRVRGRAALDLDLLKAAAAAIPGGSVAEIEYAYFGASDDDGPPPAVVGRFRSLAQDLRSASARRRARTDAAVLIAAIALVGADPPDLSSRSDHGVLAYRTRLLDLGVRAMTAELAVAATAGADYARLEAVLRTDLDDESAAGWAQRVTRGAGLPPRPTPMASMSIFAGPSWDEAGVDPPALRSAFDGSTLEDDRAELMTLLRADRSRRRRRAMTGQIVDIRMHLLRRLIGDAIHDLGRREQTKSAVLRLGGEVRRVHLELGRRLVVRGLLDDAIAVEHLGTRELVGALSGQAVAPALIRRRRRLFEQWEREGPLPTRFRGVPPPAATAPVAAGGELRGRAASPGRCTATAVVVHAPSDPFPEGAVLVAAATDAAWSPLFLRAGAVVVERGGPLSHAAIVARELGLPAVLDVVGATRSLDRKTVTVDGDRGVVTVHRTAGAAS